ncbi:hypothetical protein [Streptomyces sp. NPDC088350]|uniref:hypothetical protein n=1 Tax=Streptomyces sp. NPDC088350 TaxID=3365854 RepID=UPI00381D2353
MAGRGEGVQVGRDAAFVVATAHEEVPDLGAQPSEGGSRDVDQGQRVGGEAGFVGDGHRWPYG